MTPTTAQPAGASAAPATETATETPAAEPNTTENGAFNFETMSDEQLGEFLGLPPAVEAKEESDDPAAADTANSDKEVDAALGAGEGAEAVPDPAEGAEAKKPGDDPANADAKTDTEKAADKKAAFVVYDAEGKAIDPATLPVAEIEFTVAGKTHKAPLDKLVRMAQSGGYNEVLQSEVKEARELLPQYDAALREYDTAHTKNQDYLTKLLADPEFYIREAEEFVKSQTPEAEVTRLREENESLKFTRAREQSTAQVGHQAQTLILPKLEALASQFSEVEAPEIMQHFAALIRPYRAHGGGVVAAEHIPAVVDALERDVTPWVQQLHEARAEKKRLLATAATVAKDATTRAQQQASAQVTKAKAELAREIAPVGRTAPTAKPKPRPKNANEAATMALEDALASVGA